MISQNFIWNCLFLNKILIAHERLFRIIDHSVSRCVVVSSSSIFKTWKISKKLRKKKIILDSMIEWWLFFYTYFNLNLEGSWSHSTKLITTKVKVKRKPARKKILIINLYNIFGSQRKKKSSSSLLTQSQHYGYIHNMR